MSWRSILEAEHRLVLEVVDAAETECDHAEQTGRVRGDLVDAILAFFRYFTEGLHDPKEDGLLFARCRKRGMTEEDEPLGRLVAEHEWVSGRLDTLQRELYDLAPGDREGSLRFAAELRELAVVVRCHVEVEETRFFDLAEHYLTAADREQLSEEFASVHYDEVEEGVQAHWADVAHRLSLAEKARSAGAA